jgi:preprotein translocase subunit SecD
MTLRPAAAILTIIVITLTLSEIAPAQTAPGNKEPRLKLLTTFMVQPTMMHWQLICHGDIMSMKVFDLTLVDDMDPVQLDRAQEVLKKRLKLAGYIHFQIYKISNQTLRLEIVINAKDPTDTLKQIVQTGFFSMSIVINNQETYRKIASHVMTWMNERPENESVWFSKESEPVFKANSRKALEDLATFLREKELMPAGMSMGFQLQDPMANGNYEEAQEWLGMLIEEKPSITNDDLESAKVTINEWDGQPVVMIHFNKRGTQRFANLTAANVRRMLAIMIDDEIYSAPVIQERIPGGRAQVSLGRGKGKSPKDLMNEGKALASLLQSGYLPPLSIAQQEIGFTKKDNLLLRAINPVSALGGLIMRTAFGCDVSFAP